MNSSETIAGTVCPGHKCKAKDECWRYLNNTRAHRAMFATAPGEDEGCDFFMPDTRKHENGSELS